ncbi:MAG TPA: L,D-transpeptidase [Myxococcota bacterium]|jgi:hypothetical protein
MLPLSLLGAGGDPGVLLELDRDAYVVVARDLRAGVNGPALRVAVGSPAHPTPTGSFPLREVVHNPGWSPGPTARRAGARPEPPSKKGPLGAAKIPFQGTYALHGGSRPLLLGKPITLGCLRSADPELLELLTWLGQQGALGAERRLASGELHQSFVRPARLVIR